MRRAARVTLALALAPLPLHAQPRPLAIAPGTVLRAEVSSVLQEIALRRNDIARCFDEASARSPARLDALRRVDITLRLDRQGRASTVVIDPPLLAPGLSECLATTLLPWQQRGRVGPRAVVRLVVTR